MAHGVGPGSAVAAVGRLLGPHPEALPHEVFLMNATDETWPRITWRTKRRGHAALGLDGSVLPGRYPVFVDRGELSNLMER